jgi:hypothetical protein
VALLVLAAKRDLVERELPPDRSAVNAYLLPAFGELPLEEISTGTIETWRAELIERDSADMVASDADAAHWLALAREHADQAQQTGDSKAGRPAFEVVKGIRLVQSKCARLRVRVSDQSS